MKLILILLLFLPSLSFAWIGQNSEAYILNYLRWGAKYELGSNYQQDLFYGAKPDVLKQNKVGVVKSYTLKKNGKKKEWYERTYDLSGRLIQMKTDGNTVNYKFADTLLNEIQRITKKHTFKTKIGYDSQSRIVKISSFKDEKLTSETNYVYFSGDKASLVEKKIYGKKLKTYRLETDYDELLKKPSEARYVINGELEKRWTYNCGEKGEIQKNKVDEVTLCHYYGSNNDGSYTSYTRTIEDGKDVLQESTFSKDSIFLEYKCFIHDSILVSHNTYSKDKHVYENFTKRGKRIFKYSEEMDSNGNITKYTYYSRKDKVSSFSALSYSETNLIQEVTYKTGRKVQFEYTYL